MSSVRLSIKEITEASRWANEHNEKVHQGKLEWADFKIIVLDSNSGIGSPTVINCEACDRVKVTNQNHHYITDYDCW